MNMKKFKSFIAEAQAVSPEKKDTQSFKTSERQRREKEALIIKHEREKAAAREADFRKKEAERKLELQRKAAAKQQNEEIIDFSENTDCVYEYLEDGTIQLVKAYEKSLKS